MSVGGRELRVVLRVDDQEGAVDFYRNVIGFEHVADWSQPQGKGTLLKVERATLEIVDARMSESIDAIEVGHSVSGPVRLAISVTDVDEAARALAEAGAPTIGAPQTSPWGDRVARAQTPHGLQLTLFTEPAD